MRKTLALPKNIKTMRKEHFNRRREKLVDRYFQQAFQGELTGDEMDEAEAAALDVGMRQKMAVSPEPVDVGARQLRRYRWSNLAVTQPQ